MIALRQDFTSFSRQADAKIALLKEAIERVKAGEEVDVKALLGTGDPQKEREWEEGMRQYKHIMHFYLPALGSSARNRRSEPGSC